MRYVPFDRLSPDLPHMMVDSYGKSSSCVLELNHWPRNGTPEDLKRDTSTESVVEWVERQRPVSDRLDVPYVSNDHYDVDGLLAIWAAINAERLSESREDLVAVATTEDFNRFVDERSLRTTLELMAIEKHGTRRLVRDRVWNTDRFTAGLYEALLPEVTRCFTQGHRFEHDWGAEMRFVLKSLDAIATRRGAATIVEDHALDLAVVSCDWPLHPFAIHAATERCRILVLASGMRPSFSYRYESFVEMVSRRIPPRLPLKPLAALLNRDEQNGIWFGEGMLAAHPRVQLFSNDESVVQSSLGFTGVAGVVRSYLRTLGVAGLEGWVPTSGLSSGPELEVLPPSLERSLERRSGE